MLRSIVLCSVLAVASARAEAQGELAATRAKVSVLIDGQVEEDEWAGAARIDGFMQFEPTVGAPALQKTEA